MAKKEKKAKDPQEEKLLTPEKAVTPEGASEIKNESTVLKELNEDLNADKLIDDLMEKCGEKQINAMKTRA